MQTYCVKHGYDVVSIALCLHLLDRYQISFNAPKEIHNSNQCLLNVAGVPGVEPRS